MVIKKYSTKKTKPADRQKLLDAYARQGRSYRKTQKGQSRTPVNLLRGSLAALIPLAAVGTLSAQCQGALNGGADNTIAYNPASTGTKFFGFDVDGAAGNDFSLAVFHYTFRASFLLKGLGSFYFDKNNNYVQQHPAGFTVTRAQAQFVQQYIFLCNANNSGNFCVNDGAGYIAIRKGNSTTGQPGWIHFQTTEFGSGNVKFKIFERGVESLMNSPLNSAITNDCPSMAVALPVEMLYFRPKVADKNILLEWATASEQNNSGFEVQRSTDGRGFHKIGWVPGYGTTVEQKSYSFEDKEVQANTNYYYRLKQLDIDGTEEFSPVRSAMIEDKNSFKVGALFPNPTSQEQGFSMFKLNVPEEGELGIQVFDLKGSLVKELSKSFPKGKATLSVPVADLADGQYFVKLQLGRQVEYRRLVVD